jgi:hypothetical protein
MLTTWAVAAALLFGILLWWGFFHLPQALIVAIAFGAVIAGQLHGPRHRTLPVKRSWRVDTIDRGAKVIVAECDEHLMVLEGDFHVMSQTSIPRTFHMRLPESLVGARPDKIANACAQALEEDYLEARKEWFATGDYNYQVARNQRFRGLADGEPPASGVFEPDAQGRLRRVLKRGAVT